ncbi:hypothetical protein [Cystobacter ferrugineus]|uniref:Tetratricopeptide repeat domain protein n=1 Tax=Cystobacter ferrugineus TaxID=83449 RepID=A0A1L9B3G3_9BACT|nr:hypothetical protein [Cystobacter ferrugineus]OJH36784.1 hypothetical protein BON30_30215 [Cystobacter ferrugineus]
MSRCLCLLVMLGLWVPGITLAAEWVDEEVPALRATYEYGHYAEVIERAASRIDRGRLSEQDLLELHKLAGLSAFHLHRTDEATRHFRALLRLDPDFHLDPFAVPPPAVNFLDTLRGEMEEELERVRQERRARQERERAEAERRERERVEAEEQRRRMEELSRQVTVRQVEKRSLLVNFVPFGAGQFQQGRTGMGALFAASEGLLAATSLAAFFAHQGLFQTEKVTVDDVRGPREVQVRFIPTSSKKQAELLSAINWYSALGFYGVYALGVVEALWRHQDEVVSTRIETPPDPAAPRARLHLVPTSGGASAGFTLSF